MKRTLIKGIVVTAAAVTLPLGATTAAMAGTHEAVHSALTAQAKNETQSNVGARLLPGQTLTANQKITSQNGKFRLVMQADGNFVQHQKVGKKWIALWSTRTHGHGGAKIVMQTDGNLVIYAKNGKAIWHTGTAAGPGNNVPGAGTWLAVQNDSNVVLYSKTNQYVWHKNVYIGRVNGGYTLYPNQIVRSPNGRYKFTLQSDSNLVLYDTKHNNKPLWSSKTNGRKATRVEMQKDGNLVMYKGRTPIWASNSARNRGAWLAMQNDGNVVVYTANNQRLWDTGTGNPNRP